MIRRTFREAVCEERARAAAGKNERLDKPEEYCILTGQLRKSKEESVSGREESEASRGGAETTRLD